MVCYARPASRLVAIIFVAWLVFAGPARHFLGTAALATAVLAAVAVAAVAAAVVFATFTSVKRRRAAAGGCVTCKFRCQQAMTEPARSASVLLSNPTVRSAALAADSGLAAPRWPDRPAYRAGRVLQADRR